MTLTLEKLGPNMYGGLGATSDDSDLVDLLNDLPTGSEAASATGSAASFETSGTPIQTYYDANGNLIIPGGISGNAIDGYTSISPSGQQTTVQNTVLPSAGQTIQNTVGSAADAQALANSFPVGSSQRAQYQAIANSIALATGQSTPNVATPPASSSTVLILGGVAVLALLLVISQR
jgi:hypothetical protein